MSDTIPLRLDELRALFDSTYLQRGIDYVRRGYVRSIEVEQDGRVIYSTVSGRGGRYYNCSISLDPRYGEVTRIRGYCSCPVSNNCKHVAATLYQKIRDQQGTFEHHSGASTSVDIWLRLIKQSVNVPRRVSGPTYELHFLLSISSGGYQRVLTVKTVKTHQLKSGNWSKPTTFTTGSKSAAAFLNSSDMELLIMLEVVENRHMHGAGHYQLPTKGAESVLQRLAECGRAHWQSLQHTALVPGGIINGELDWDTNDQGIVNLQISDPADDLTLLPCSPPWYFDSIEHTVGRFVTGLDEAVDDALVVAPAIPADQCETVSIALQRAFPGEDMPIPRGSLAPVRDDIPAVPHLRLHSEHQEDHYGLVTFSYDGHTVLPQEEQIHMSWKDSEGQVVRVQRNQLQESVYMQQLIAVDVYVGRHYLSQDGLRVEHEHGTQGWVGFGLNVVSLLQQDGWVIEYDPSWALRVVEADAWYADVEQGSSNDWFDLELGVRVDGQSFSLLPMLVRYIADNRGAGNIADLLDEDAPLIANFMRDGKQHFIQLPFEKVKHILQTLVDLYDPDILEDNGKLRMSRYQSTQLNQLADTNLEWGGATAPGKFAKKLANFDGIKTLKPPPTLKAELRGYQQQGFDWLQFLRKYELGGILADDMGLGKTVQALAHLLKEKSAGRAQSPSLVVATTSLMVNWASEVARFAPSLKVLTLQGSQRKQFFDQIADFDLVLTTYPLLPRDSEVLLGQDWHVLILDESQHIKNARSRVAQTACQLKARHRLCLTGTPMENHLGELWSQFNFLMPGLLGNEQHFRKLFRNPIEKQGDQMRQQQLNRRIKPFMLRREKSQVLAELPAKTEITSLVELEGKQRQLYETIRVAMDKRVRQEIDKKGIARSQIIILDALLKLRQVCCDPRLLKMDAAKKINQSAKLIQLKEMLPELLEEGRRILLFSQFTSMLALIEPELDKLKIPFVKLTGQTRDRATPIARFQAKEVPLFLISLKAGGAGLNLTAADTVIHYDPWWNPAVERQATDRAHRIGQKNKVFVYKLMASGTVEEKIHAMQQKKQALADALFDGSKASVSLGKDDLKALFEPLG